MKKYKKSELESFRNKFRNKQGTRVDYLAYAFLRGVPYRLQERKTHWDHQGHYEPGQLVSLNFGYSVCKLVAQIEKIDKSDHNFYEQFQKLLEEFDGWCTQPLEGQEES